MHEASELLFHEFGSADPLSQLVGAFGHANYVGQAEYLRWYLLDLGAKAVVEEPQYFDRDYLSEFSAFYAESTRGYPNICRRLHFFSEKIGREELGRALGGNSPGAIAVLQDSYLGFSVLRPIPKARLGRTVVRWYPDPPDLKSTTPRVTTPSRPYTVHLCGLPLTVEGLAWQQQDTGVSACATVALWSILHSSAFDEHHSVPTTAEITRSAHRTASLGMRVFPAARGLLIQQLCEAIKEQGLSPILIPGKPIGGDNFASFNKDIFSTICATLLRSGYPVLVGGQHISPKHIFSGHAICMVGFRECSAADPATGEVSFQDEKVEYCYIHDDNLGPNVRFRIAADKDDRAILFPEAPPESLKRRPGGEDPVARYGAFLPQQLVVAVHHELRTLPTELSDLGFDVAQVLTERAQAIGAKTGAKVGGVAMSVRFMKLSTFFKAELPRILGGSPDVLAKARLALSEKVRPMSLHLGIVRLSMNKTLIMDILYDTTDTDLNLPAFARIMYVNSPMLASLTSDMGELGPTIDAF